MTLACEQALHLGLTQYLFWARFGREPREDWDGGEVRRACRHDWRIFISTPETKFHRKFKIWQELVNQTASSSKSTWQTSSWMPVFRKLWGNFRPQQTFGSNWKNGKLHKWKVCFEIMTFCRTSHKIWKKFNIPIFCGGERAAKQCGSLCFGICPFNNQYYSRSDRRGKSTGDYLVYTFQLVFSSVERVMEKDVRQIGSKSTNHSPMAWRREG